MTYEEKMRRFNQDRFGIYVHFGLYSLLGRGEWTMYSERIPAAEYAKLADKFQPHANCAREWVEAAVAAGAKYMVLTTRHHEGFCLFDSAYSDYTSAKLGCKRDIVREYVDAARAAGLRVGLYYSLLDWRFPGYFEPEKYPESKAALIKQIFGQVRELMTNYGKIDILEYDGGWDAKLCKDRAQWAEFWNAVELNKMVRSLQPDIIINDRSRLAEDFGTPEEHVTASERDWEACMTFNGISWGYLDEEQVRGYSYNAPRILKMLNTCCKGGGNLLLNIGPKPDGSVPSDAVTPLTEVGEWLSRNGEVVYGRRLGKWDRFGWNGGANGISSVSCSEDGKTCYLWCWIWPKGGSMAIGGYFDAPRKVSILSTGEEIRFSHDGHRIILEGLPEKCPDPSGIAVIKLEFNDVPEYHSYGRYPQMNEGRQYKTKNKR